MQMRDRISAFLEEKQGLSVNSKQSYKYDLEQFLDVVGLRISETSLKIYQAQLANLKISAQKRKLSACNQFLYFLYQKGEVDRFYRLELAKQAEKKTEKPEILELASFWQESDYPEGRLLALLILEMGLLPSEILSLKIADINLDFQVLRINKASQRRIVTIPTTLIPELESLICSRALIMGNQTVAFDGSPEELFKKSTDELQDLGLTKPPSVELSLAVPSLGYCKSMDELKSKLVAQLGRK